MKSLISTIIIVILIAVSLSRVEGYGHLMNVVHAFCLFGIFVVLIKNNFRLVKRNNLSILIFLFVITSGISAFVNQEGTLFLNAILIAIILVFSLIALPTINKIDINKIDINKRVIISLVLTHIPLILIPILITGVNTTPYKGIFYNSNTFGNTMATIYSTLFAIYIFYLQRYIEGSKQKFFILKSAFFGTILLSMVYLVMISSSRTSFISVAVTTVLGLLILGYCLIKTKKIYSFILKGFLFSFIAGIILLALKFTNFYNSLYYNIVLKFQTKIQRGDVFDTRADIWSQTLAEAGFFGQGSKYFNENFNLGAHNTFISIIGTFGYIPAIFLFVLLIVLFIKSLKFSLSNTEVTYKYLPIILALNFFVLSMGEDMLFKLSMFLLLLSVGSIYRNSLKSSQSSNIVQ